jgi:hypothetical protein
MQLEPRYLTAMPMEEKYWKPSKHNPVKPFYRKAEWIAGTSLDEVLEGEEEDEDEIDSEHPFQGHCK